MEMLVGGCPGLFLRSGFLPAAGPVKLIQKIDARSRQYAGRGLTRYAGVYLQDTESVGCVYGLHVHESVETHVLCGHLRTEPEPRILLLGEDPRVAEYLLTVVIAVEDDLRGYV